MSVHKTIEQARQNLSDATAKIPARYIASVQKAEWVGPASSSQAEANYQAGVQDAISKKTRVAGIQKVGNQGWRDGAVTKGAAVIAMRITNALPKYVTNFSPILSAMNSAADAAPAPTRDAMQNIETRLKPVVLAAKAAAGKS